MSLSLKRKSHVYCLVALLASLVMLVDYLLTVKGNQYVVESKYARPYTRSPRSSNSYEYGISTGSLCVPIERYLFLQINEGDSVVIYKTRLLQVVTRLEFNEQLSDSNSIYNAFCLFPIAIFLTSVLALRKLFRGVIFPDNLIAINLCIFGYLIFSYILNVII